jgi:hypothetical protein
MSLLKGPYEPAAGDTVIQGIVSNDLYEKYQHELSADEFNEIGDELVTAGYFQWNNDGQLALTTKGLDRLARLYEG